MTSPDTVSELLVERATSERMAGYTYIDFDESTEESRSYRALDEQARSIGAALSRLVPAGSRAVLLFKPGLEFIDAFFACLYAGVIAVPVYPPTGPNLESWVSWINHVIDDSKPECVLTTQDIIELRDSVGIEIGPPHLQWVAVDAIAPGTPGGWSPERVHGDHTAFIQYTSGSTRAPRGVVVRHENLIANQRAILESFDPPEVAVAICWLPQYHDMGLIGCLLHPLYVDKSTVVMSPVAFLQRPGRLLELITRYSDQAVYSGGPNFAYELLLKRTTEEERQRYDLSSWEVAYTGAEPVRSSTIDRFCDAFAAAGFRRSAFLPCYGLAEATLMVTGTRARQGGNTIQVNRAALDAGTVLLDEGADGVTAVSSGPPTRETTVRIVDPDALVDLGEGRVGEIWVQSPSVTQGYWNQEAETQSTFHVATANGDGEEYLRTGDLGFLHEGELFVTGRMKEVLIVRGRTLHPFDIEDIAQATDPRLRRGCGAAFGLERGDSEQVVLVQETNLTDESDCQHVAREIQRAVIDGLQVAIDAIVFVPSGTVPKTSSGKVKRLATKALYESESLEPIYVA